MLSLATCQSNDLRQNKWFYVGAHTWNIIDVLPTWPELGRKVSICNCRGDESH